MSVAGAGMSGSVTGLVSGLGGIQGLGELGINTDLIQSGSFDSMGDMIAEMGTTVTDSITGLSDVCGDFVGDALADLPAGLTGTIDSSIFSDYALEGLDFSSDNLFTALGNQSSDFLSGGMAGLTECINTAKGFVDQAAGMYASLQNAANFNIGGMSFNALTIFDQCTGGAVSKVLSPVNSVLGAAQGVVGLADTAVQTAQSLTTKIQNSIDAAGKQFTSFADDLSKMGTMYSYDSFEDPFTPMSLMTNLQAQGLGEGFNTVIEKTGVTIAQTILSNPTNTGAALDALKQMPMKYVDEIKEKTNFGVNITGLDQVLVPAAVLGASTLALVNDFKGLSDRVASIGPNTASNFSQLGQVLKQIELPKASQLIGLESDLSKIETTINSQMDTAKKIIGSGNGVFGNPTMDDVMGSFTGRPYNEKLALILEGQKFLMNSPAGQNLKTVIEQATVNAKSGAKTDQADANEIRRAANSFTDPATPEIAEIVALINRLHGEILEQFVLEKRNHKAARLNARLAIGGLSSILGFLSSLETAHIDDFETGYRQFVEDAASPDIYGDAIKAAMIEAKNRALLQSIGITPRTVLATNYADEQNALRSAILAKCCPSASLGDQYLRPDYSPPLPPSLARYRLSIAKPEGVVDGETNTVFLETDNIQDGTIVPYSVTLKNI